MKDPTRLLHASACELEQQLLRAAAIEQPPSAAMQRLAERLGVRVHAQPAPAKLPLLAAHKGLLVISAATLATLGAAGWLATRGDVHTTPQPPAPAPIATQAPATTDSLDAPAPDTHSLAQEIARIDAVRRELTARRVQPALAALQDYQRDFPSGVLRQEAELLNIEAHQQAGERRRARTLAARFLTNNPDSPHSARVRDLLESLGTDAR